MFGGKQIPRQKGQNDSTPNDTQQFYNKFIILQVEMMFTHVWMNMYK